MYFEEKKEDEWFSIENIEEETKLPKDMIRANLYRLVSIYIFKYFYIFFIFSILIDWKRPSRKESSC